MTVNDNAELAELEVTGPQAAEHEVEPEAANADGQQDEKKTGVRQLITDLEGERDGLSAQLAAAHAQTFDHVCASLNQKADLIRAVGLSVADYVTDDGTVDIEALTVAVDEKRAELGLSRRPLPDPLAGIIDGRREPETRTLGQVLREVSRND